MALIATDREGGDLKAYVVSNDKSTHMQTLEPWNELPIDELQKARETKKCHNERLYLRRREDGRSNLPTRPDNPERLPPDAKDETSAIKCTFAVAGCVIEESINDRNALLYCLAENTPNANATQLEAHYQTMRLEILTCVQRHEDTYKRRVRIDVGTETEAKRNEAWQAKKPMLVVYSRGGGEKLIQIDAKQRPEGTEPHFPVRLGQNHYARATRQRNPVNSIPEAAPVPPPMKTLW